MRLNPKILNVEAQERIDAEVATSIERRLTMTYEETLAALDLLRKDEKQEAY